MFGIHNYPEFIVAILIFMAIPGPGTISILNATGRGGCRSGMGAVAGIWTGDLLLMLGAVLGLATLLAARPAILDLMQWWGAGYLCWLGWKLLRSTGTAVSNATDGGNQFSANFRQSLAVCLTNPKAILFYFAFFPLFLAEHSTPFTQAMMIAHVSVIGLLYQTGLVVAGQAARRACARYAWTGRWGRRLAGATLIGFGLKLAFNRR